MNPILPMLLSVLWPLLGAAPSSPAITPPLQDTGAEAEWDAFQARVIPRIQEYRLATEEQRKTLTFHREIAEIGAFVRKYAESDPDYAAAARVFLATQLLDDILGQTREAAQILRNVAQTAASPLIAGMAALHACEIFLRQGDEPAIEEVIEQYSQREEHEPAFLEMMGDLRKRIRLSPGRPFPDLALVDRAGRPQGAATHRGRVWLLCLFNGANDSSDEALKRCQALAEQWKEKGLTVVGVSLDRKAEELDAALKKAGAAFPIVWDGQGWEGEAVKQLGISTVPTFFVVGRDGRIRFSWVRLVELNEAVRTALELPDEDPDGGAPGPGGPDSRR